MERGTENDTIVVNSPFVTYTSDHIISTCEYSDSIVRGNVITPKSDLLQFRTEKRVARTGVMLVGWGGNNGSTFTASIIANKLGITWMTKSGEVKANYLGSICNSMSVRIGIDENKQPVHVPMTRILPLLDPNSIEISGWDINSTNLGDAMRRAKVLDFDLQQQVYSVLKEMVPLPSFYLPEWISASQRDRANNLIQGTKQEVVDILRNNIRDFKAAKNLEKVIVIWTANTEKFATVKAGLNDTAEHLLSSISKNSEEISVSTLFAVASLLENCPFVNGSPQNTLIPGVIDLAERNQVPILGDDFKSGQTKLKSVLSDFLVNSGLKLCSLVSYNHLGNNDIKNLSTPQASGSKELSKSGIIEEIVRSNRVIYSDYESPDHCVVFKYVPYVGDNKTAMDEYMSEIFMGGTNTLVLHNTGEDSLLAAALMVDIAMLVELCTRVEVRCEKEEEFKKLNQILSILSYLMKSPVVPAGSPVSHCLFPQRFAIINFVRALVGLPVENFLMLEHRLNCLRNN